MTQEIIILDTEYTTWKDAKENGWSAPGQHREIVQIAAIQFDLKTGVEKAKLDILVKPKFNGTLSDLFIELTSIKQEHVNAKGYSFPDALNKFFTFCQNVPPENILCFNADEDVFKENCALHDIHMPFSTPWKKLRPALPLLGVDVENNSSGTLHKFTDTPLEGHTHYALHDVRSMGAFLYDQIKKGKHDFFTKLPLEGDPLVPLNIKKAIITRMNYNHKL